MKKVVSAHNNNTFVSFNHRNYKKKLPMTIFTSEENKPTEFTLRLIRQMAYTYRVARIDGRAIPFTLN